MARLIFTLILALTLIGCRKDDKPEQKPNCNIEEARSQNQNKITITSGIYGTVSMMEGNCQPIIEPGACTHCPAKRIVRVYEYTKRENALPSNTEVFYDSFNTRLVAETETDDKGFYQLSIPPGHYTIITIELGKLYAGSFDGAGGLSPFNLENTGELLKLNLVRTYKAVF